VQRGVVTVGAGRKDYVPVKTGKYCLNLSSSLLHLSCGHSAFYIHIQPSIFNRSLLLPSTDGSSVPLFSSISFVLLKVFPSFILRV
jgi:hypothetical protein